MKKNTYLIDMLLLSLVLGLFFFIGLGSRPLFVPDEGRYAEIAREMVVNQDYITPYLNGIKYFEKPVLFYWMGALAIKTFGLNLWSLRSINAILSLLCCLMTYLITRHLYQRLAGLLAAFILGTSSLYFVMTHMISLDLPVTVFISGTLYAFIAGVQSSSKKAFHYYLAAAAASTALAVLTKGLMGILLPGFIILTWISLTKQWRTLKRIPFILCILIFLVIAAPWHIAAGLRNPEFFYFYFIEQQFLRYTTLNIGHYQPDWFFIPCLIVGFFPWIVFLPQTIYSAWKSRKISPVELFFFLWAAIIFLFFSFSKSKLIPYILPVFPPLSILTANYLYQRCRQQPTISLKISFLMLTLFAGIIAYFFIQYPHARALPNVANARFWLSAAAAILMTGSITAAMMIFRHTFKAILIIIATAILFLLTALSAVPSIDTRSILPLTNTLKPLLSPDDIIVSYNQYHQDLPFYLERQIEVLNWRNELTFGMQHQPKHDWLINDQLFWQQWHSPKRLFVIMSNDEFTKWQKDKPTKNTHIIDQTVANILISNK